jgi:SAM-dependent methyltransferase
VTQISVVAPDEAVKFILLQRTGLQKLNFKLLRKLGVDYYPRLCEWESRWRREAIIRGFAESIQHDYDEIRPHLPTQVESILDIGCGVAGIDVALNQHYSVKPPHFHLLDKSTVSEKVYYDFHAAGAYYNSLAAAKSLLLSNGVASTAVTCLEATPESSIAITRPIDLIISLISWGFHYPVSTYLSEVARVLAPAGSLIMDVRSGSDGMEELQKQLPQVTVIKEYPKWRRVLAKRS